MTSQEINMDEGENPSDKVVIGPNKPPQKSFTHYVIQIALDQIDALCDCLIAIQASKYEVEKNTITSLAFLIREKTQNLKQFIEEMSKQKRSIAPSEPISSEMEESPFPIPQPEPKNLLLAAIIRWYEKESKKPNDQ